VQDTIVHLCKWGEQNKVNCDILYTKILHKVTNSDIYKQFGTGKYPLSSAHILLPFSKLLRINCDNVRNVEGVWIIHFGLTVFWLQNSRVSLLKHCRSDLFWMDDVTKELFPASHPNNLNHHGCRPRKSSPGT